MWPEGTNRRVAACESCGQEKWVYDFDDEGAEGLCTMCYRATYEGG